MGKSLKYKVLQFSVFILLILSVLFLFNACNKDALIDDESIGYRADYANRSEMINDFYNAFNQEKSQFLIDEISEISPFYYNINKVSAFIPSLFNDTAVIFNVSSNSLNNYSRYLANQILVKKNRYGDFEISHLIYIPDSEFYANKNYFPLLINFTGDIIELNEKSEYKSIYELNYGEISEIFSRTRNFNFGFSSNELDNISLRDAELYEEDLYIPEWLRDIIRKIKHGGIKCWNGESSGTIKHFKSKKKSSSGNGGNIVIPDLVWGDPTNSGWQSGGGSSGGTAPLPCQNPKTFWDTYGKPTYKNYVEALSILAKEYGLSIFDDIFHNNSGCSVSYENILCGTANCFSSFESTYLSLEQILGCLRTYISNVANNDSNESDCQDAIDNFNLEYGTNFTANDLYEVFDANPNICANLNAFNELVISTYLVNVLNLTNEQRLWLDLGVNLNTKHKLFEYQLNNTYPNEALNYFIWAMMNHGHDLNFYTTGYDTFGKEDNTIFYPPPSKIKILNSFVPNFDPSHIKKFAETQWYNNAHVYDPLNNIIPQDLQHGTNGNTNLLSRYTPANRELLNLNNHDLLMQFDNLIHKFELNSNLQNVATDYYNRFVSGEGGDYFNEELCNYILTNGHTIATVQDFGKKINELLKELNGDFSRLNYIQLRPTYLAKYDKGELHSGLKILINDTEKMFVYDMGDYTFNSATNEWSISLYFQIFDNFGLDNEDLLDSQGIYVFDIGKKFAAWWILQHVRNYVPFRTEIRTVFKIKGDLDDVTE